MQIQKGLVKYKDRTDIVCSYGITDNDKQYYFLDEDSMDNGNIIASTVLVEAIDPTVAASSIGVIDRLGSVIVPFENKSIKVVLNNILLVEKAKPVSSSVVEAIKLRSDPLAATKLVSTAATIKEKLNAKMGFDGRFIFNDQFSEVTLCDFDGNNLVNDEYYSFVGIAKDNTLYLAKNTVDSAIVEYSLGRGVVVTDPGVTESTLDIKNTDVTRDIINGAVESMNENRAVSNGVDTLEKLISSDDVRSVIEENLENVEATRKPNIPSTQRRLLPDFPVVEDRINEEIKQLVGSTGASVLVKRKLPNFPKVEDEVNDEIKRMVNKSEKYKLLGFPVVEEGINEEIKRMVREMDRESVTVGSKLPNFPKVEEEVNEEIKKMVQKSGKSKLSGFAKVERSINEEIKKMVQRFDKRKLPAFPKVEDEIDEEIKKIVRSTHNPLDDFHASKLPDFPSIEDEINNEVRKVNENEVPVKRKLVDFPKVEDEINDEIKRMVRNAKPISAAEVAKETSVVKPISAFSEANNKYNDLSGIDSSVLDFKEELFNDDYDEDIFAGSKLHADDIDFDDGLNSDYDLSLNDNIIEDVASTMSSLISLNRKQRQQIMGYEVRLNQAVSAHRQVVEKAKSQGRDIESLRNKLKNYEVVVAKLENKNHMLEDKVHDLDRAVISKTNEVETLKSQLEGKNELARVLADAQTLLEQTN